MFIKILFKDKFKQYLSNKMANKKMEPLRPETVRAYIGALFNKARPMNLVKFIKKEYGKQVQVCDFMFRQASTLPFFFSEQNGFRMFIGGFV